MSLKRHKMGWGSGGGAGSGFTVVGHISATSSPFAYPAGMQAGDIIILMMHAHAWDAFDGYVGSSISAPTGYTSDASVTDHSRGTGPAQSTDHTGRMCHKIATGSEGSTESFSSSSSGGAVWVYGVVLRAPTAATAMAWTGTTVGSTAISEHTITCSGGSAPIVAVAGFSPPGINKINTLTLDGVQVYSDDFFEFSAKYDNNDDVIADATGDPVVIDMNTQDSYGKFICGYYEITLT